MANQQKEWLDRITVLGVGVALGMGLISGWYLLIGGIGILTGALMSLYINFKLLDWIQTF